jgi:hypothetical protein
MPTAASERRFRPGGTRWCPEEGRRIADVLLGRIDVQGGDLVASYLHRAGRGCCGTRHDDFVGVREGGDGREDGSGVADGDALPELSMRPG